MSLPYNHGNSYLFVNRKEICTFQANYNNFNFPSQFCLGSKSNKFYAIDSREVSLEGSVHDFSVDYIAIDKSEISNI